ncbi:HYC_CC_PP family protein [Olleya sp. R77988]|uniref:HYC_CC_PP family protein n=1 Tax=Olleya sp. R77988 TaxID=3093875 RepID=UPI0037C59A71
MYFCNVIKVILHKCFSVLMALVVLFSTLSFTIESHYCGDHLVDKAVFTKAKKCGAEAVVDGVIVKTKPCCKDIIEVVKGQDQLNVKTTEGLDVNTQYLITSFVYTYFQLYQSLPKQIIPHKNYLPPNLIIDYQTLHDVYII